MRAVNITDIIDAFRNEEAVFSTMKNVRLATDNTGEIIFASERNTLLIGAEIEGKPRILRILLEESGVRERIIFNSSLVKRYPDAPVADMSFHPRELLIHDTYGCSKYLDILEIDDEPSEILSLISQGDLQYGNENLSIVTGLLETVEWFISRNLVVDRFNYDCCCYLNGKVKISFVYDTGICKSPNNSTLIAFKNYAAAMAIHMLLVLYGEQDFVNDADEKFRLVNASYYASPEFTETVEASLRRLEIFSGKKFYSFRLLLATTRPVEAIRLLNNVIWEVSSDNEAVCTEINPLFDAGRYDIEGECSEDRIPVRDKNSGLCGFTSLSGEKNITCEFENVSDFYEGIAVVHSGGLYGAIDRDGTKIVPLEYDYLSWEKANNIFIFRLGGKYGLMDREGNIIVQTAYTHIDNFSNGRAIVKGLKDKFGLIACNGREVLKCEYDTIEPFTGSKAVAVINGKKKIVDIFGDTVEKEDL